MPEPYIRAAELLNRECQCITLDWETLYQQALVQGEVGADLYVLIAKGCPHLFAESAVFLGGEIYFDMLFAEWRAVWG